MYDKDCVMVINVWILNFPGKFYKDLNEFLFSTAPFENGCFLLANSYKTKNDSVLLITDMIKPSKNSGNHSEDTLKPSSSFINKCVVSADRKNSSLIFVHTHPNSAHPAKFSYIDEQSNSILFDNLSQILVNRPLGSLVFSRKGVCGVIFVDGMLQSVSRIRVSGILLHEFSGVGYDDHTSNTMNEKFDRQIRMLGREGNKKLQNLIVTVVGTGGTGSAVAVQLARMGVHRLHLIDMDVIEDTNIPRVYGSSEKDVGRPKVDVLKKHIKMFSNSKVDALHSDAANKKAARHIIDSDVIFGCTDNLTSRSILNNISIRYMIPLIDVGCRIDLNSDNSILQATVKVQTVTPDSACLWCTETLDGKKILQESLSEKEKQKLAGEGYHDKIEAQPSIISMTTMSASLAVNKLLSILGTFGDAYSTRTQVELKDGFMVNDTPEIVNNCICRKNMGRTNSGVTKKEQRDTVMQEKRASLASAVLKCLRKVRFPWRCP